MSEADRIFPRQPRRGVSTGERQHIVTAPRKNSSGTIASRVVEVVHVSRGIAQPVEGHPRRVPWHAHAETWPEGFRAKSPPLAPPQDAQSFAPEPAPPTVHVMPMWEPSAQPAAPSDELPASTPAMEHRKPRGPKPRMPAVTERRFADPFAEEDDGANCIRCGYLVERAREARGLMTCAQCG